MKPFRIIVPLLAVLAIAPLSSACDGNADEEGDRIKVVTSLSVFQDMASQIGGARVEARALAPSGADPHTYEPVPSHVALIAEADVVFVNGFGLEPAVLRVIDPNLPSDATLTRIGEDAAEEGASLRHFDEGDAHEDGDDDTGVDPHLWLSVDNARLYAGVIRDALTQADPEGTDAYEANLQEYLAQLDGLDLYVREAISALSPDDRKLVTTHDAFGYMAAYMGLEVAAVVTVSPGQEPSAAAIAELRRSIEDSGVAAVFEEPQLGAESSVLRRAADDLGVEVCTLYADTADDVPTYVDLMRFNAGELARCLRGEV